MVHSLHCPQSSRSRVQLKKKQSLGGEGDRGAQDEEATKKLIPSTEETSGEEDAGQRENDRQMEMDGWMQGWVGWMIVLEEQIFFRSGLL